MFDLDLDLDQLEALALSDDRESALAALLPGTIEHDYWRGVHLQHAGRLDEVDAILEAWQRRHGDTEEHHDRLARRQLLLRAGRDVAAHAERIREEAGVWLDDEADAVSAAQRYPTQLDPALLDEAELVRQALARAHDLSQVTDWALGDLVAAPLDATRRRHLLQRLPRANRPGVVALIAADLREESSRGFGTLAIHGRLTLAQLDELAELEPALRGLPAWVGAVLARLRPPEQVDWRHDLQARAAYLDALWARVAPLHPIYNPLKAQVLYHQLELDLRRGVVDRERFLGYLALPRQGRYARSERVRDVPPAQIVGGSLDAAGAAGLEPVGDDEPLVRAILQELLVSEDGSAFREVLRADWLEQERAVARLLAGAPDADRWAAVLGPQRLAELRDRVELELTRRNPTIVRPGAPADHRKPSAGMTDPTWSASPVELEVDVKNVPQLVVKVFRIDPVAYFLASRGAEVDTSIDLDGMTASDERTIRSDAPAMRRVRQRIPLPACARPGTYVVELVGNGRSSRALLRVGGLRHTVRVGVAGPVVRVLDGEGRPAEGARLWLGGREYAPREDGAITIPFSTAPAQVPMLLVHGDVAQREMLMHPAEQVAFSAGLHLEREALVPGQRARVLVRPMLAVAGWPATVALVEQPAVDIAVTDRAGVTSSTTQPLVLRDDAESVVELTVPEAAASIAVTVRGRVRVASRQTTIDVADRAEAPIGEIHRTEHTEALHLAATGGGHVLSLLGKTGEPRPARAVALSFKHAAVAHEITTTLETDARGRIELGPLAGVERITASLPSGLQQHWGLWPEHEWPRTVHALAGSPVTLPLPPGVPPADLAAAVVLHEVRGGAPARDVTARLAIADRRLVVAGELEPGEYVLQARGALNVRLVIAPSGAVVTDGWAAAGPVSLELSPPAPVVASVRLDGGDLVVRVHGAGPATRVHVAGTRFRAERALPRSLRRGPRPPLAAAVAPVLSHHVSGRDIGDEYRYVLERRAQPRRPGVLLEKPALLLNPWATRTTSTSVQRARGGDAYGASPARPAAAPSATAMPRSRAEASAAAAFGGPVDFLADPAVLLPNLRPDAAGVVRVPVAALGASQHVRVMLVDPALSATVDLPLPEREARARDLRLRAALEGTRHLAEERRVEGAPAGTQLVVEDVRSGKLELVDTTARAHQVLLSLGAPDPLREFGFVAEWHTLDAAARRARYAKYACHELHLFLHFRDPEFSAAVVRPYLAHKQRKTFVDRWLLGEDLSGYLEPWAFGRLNALERVLLARRLPGATASIARLTGDEVDLQPPDPERDANLVDTLLGSTALEGGGVAKSAAPAEEAPMLEMELEKGARSAARPAPKMKRMATRAMDLDEMDAPAQAVAAPMAPPAYAPGGGVATGYAGDFDATTIAADMKERDRAPALFRGADTTQEWAESDWWHVRAADVGPELIAVNRFWRDLAAHDPAAGPFLSPHLGECTDSFAAAMAALAVLDLPFAAGAHDVAVEESRLRLTCASHALAARTRIAEVAPGETRLPILVGQSYFRGDDRWEWDGAEQREKYVTGELLAGVVYVCQVVVTNPSSRDHKLSVLLQIPRGAVPVSDGFYTRTRHIHLGAYGTEALEYAFYFPMPGRFEHYPAHVTRAGELAAHAEATVLEVVREPSQVDVTSWAHVSQHGSTDDVLAFLRGANLGRVDLEKIAWRMEDRDAFERVTALLTARHVYADRLWAYATAHADRARLAEWLRHQDGFLEEAAPLLEGGVVEIDPVERAWYEHLEYAPLINARAHQLGERRQILNDGLERQYRAFLEVAAHRAAPSDQELLQAAHYLLVLDRVDDAARVLARVSRERLASRLQHDYLAAYAACAAGDLAAARRTASPWLDHPVDRWRHRFVALAAVIDEAEGRGSAAAVDADSRDQRMDELAARQPALELAIEAGAVVVQHANLAACSVRFYRMDIELLFSRQPFVQGDVDRFSWIEPGAVVDVPLGAPGRVQVPIPEAMRGANLVVEARAPGLRRAIAHYAHDLAAQLAHQYGQVRVLRASSQAPLPATYVKVYARDRGGSVSFYKDGYTDVRGRFDYATLSTDDLDRVERFAILVMSDAAGATVLEAAPPPR